MELIAHRDAPIIMAGAESVRKTCTTSSMPECWKSIAPRERGKASPMRYRNQGLSMSSDAHADEYSRYVVDQGGGC